MKLAKNETDNLNTPVNIQKTEFTVEKQNSKKDIPRSR